MKLKILRICHIVLLQKNLKLLKILLIQNSYPAYLINTLLYPTTEHQTNGVDNENINYL